MESTQELDMPPRHIVLSDWLLTACGMDPQLLQPLAGDASCRRYFRIPHQGFSYVVMDAPPPENTHAFSSIARTLRLAGLKVPEVLQADYVQGFLLLTDFGNATYLKTLAPDNADHLYDRALDALATLQACQASNIPAFTTELMLYEWALHKEWFLKKLLNLSLDTQLDDCYQQLIDAALAQPQVFMHRDFHSGNLMVLPDQAVGILDFQDAFIGPVTYDVVSLLRDCYIDWPQEKVNQWALSYLMKLQLDVSPEEFLHWFDLMSIQRHLKALMTFARKQVRDGQPGYLEHIPRTMAYLLATTASHAGMQPLHHYLQTCVQPAMQQRWI